MMKKSFSNRSRVNIQKNKNEEDKGNVQKRCIEYTTVNNIHPYQRKLIHKKKKKMKMA